MMVPEAHLAGKQVYRVCGTILLYEELKPDYAA